MNDFTCKTCGRINVGLMGPHVCPPAWLVLDPDYHGEDWSDALTIYEYEAEYAAQVAAERIDDGGGDGPQERCLVVRRKGTEDPPQQFKITYEYSVDYYAEEIMHDPAV